MTIKLPPARTRTRPMSVPQVRNRMRSVELWAVAQTRDGTVWWHYEVSTFGNVRRRTSFHHWPIGRPLKKIRKRDGYLAVNLRGDHKVKLTSVHQLVLSTFRGPPPRPDMIVRHLNGIKTDNRLSNLAWGTAKENSADAIAHGHVPRQARHGRPQAKHTLAQAAEIKGLFAVGTKNIEIVEHYNLSPQAVCNIRKGRTGGYVMPITDDRARLLLRYIRRECVRRQIRERSGPN